jgi:hypothetical protein
MRLEMNTQLVKIDHSAIKTSQAAVIILNILAFVFNTPWLVVLVASIMALGTILKVPGFGFFYRYALKPVGLLKADIRLDNHEPHRFAQGLGAIFMGAGSLCLFASLNILGWALVWLVTGLAALNLFGGFCVGCMLYYWLTRLNIPGFHKSPPEGSFPGMRPQSRITHES